MVRWIGPRCDREFARANQSHTCLPGCTVDTVFSPRRADFRAIYDAIVDHLHTLGPVHEDAVSVGVFLNTDRKLAEVRPWSADILLYLYLPLPVHDPRIKRIIGVGSSRVVHRLILRDPAAVDEFVRELLTRAFHYASD